MKYQLYKKYLKEIVAPLVAAGIGTVAVGGAIYAKRRKKKSGKKKEKEKSNSIYKMLI